MTSIDYRMAIEFLDQIIRDIEDETLDNDDYELCRRLEYVRTSLHKATVYLYPLTSNKNLKSKEK